MDNRKLTVKKDHYEFDGKPFQLLSGAMHYFRVHPDLWEDRLLKLKAMGLNTVETYMPWNLHEPKRGVFDFEDGLDIVEYLRLAERLGLLAIVRPGPYICAEWEMGGLPYWLLNIPGLKIRCMNEPYMDAVRGYFCFVFERLAPLQSTRGGPIIAMQVENEYGAYGNDHGYLIELEKIMRDNGCESLMFTADGPESIFQVGGSIEHIHATANFGSNVEEKVRMYRKYHPDGPMTCMEFWNGWFDQWGGKHASRDAGDAAKSLDDMLSSGMGVNFYMAHGGTNFGFMNGANGNGRYEPTISSYDYDAPITECGDLGPKFEMCRGVIGRYTRLPELSVSNPSKIAYGSCKMAEVAPVLDIAGKIAQAVESPTPLTFEGLDQPFGYVLYETRLIGPLTNVRLWLRGIHDRAHVYVEGRRIGIVYRREQLEPFTLDIPVEGLKLQILVENLGRVNYGPNITEYKGITEGVFVEKQQQFKWTMHGIPADDVSVIPFSKCSAPVKDPAFYRGTFQAVDVADTFLRLDGWTKGNAYVNGFNLGRYWEIGPTKTLYVPAPILQYGDNELVILELDGTETLKVEFVDTPDLG